MLNQVILVGVVQSIEQHEDGTGTVLIHVTRNYKNEQGEYDIDEIVVQLNEYLANSTFKFCGEGSTIGVKARIVSKNFDLSIHAEKVTFINTRGDN